jgi:Tropinone reductase 1
MRAAQWRLDGQTALVCGASQGIGAATARELALLGADLLLVARQLDALESLQDEIEAEFPDSSVRVLNADLTEAEDRLALFDWIADLGSELHLLINNVGGNQTRPALEYALAEVRELLELNLVSAFELSRLAHPLLARHGSAAIVNVGSVSGITHVRSGAPYGMCKAALHQLTRNLACEWAADGIRVNAVAPWYIRTRRTEAALADPAYLEEVLDRTPADRIGEPYEVAAAIAFLCLPAASYISGECVAVDGGFLRYGF